MEIHILMCTQHWRHKSTNFGHTKQAQDMEQESIQQIGSDRMFPRYVYHKPFMVRFPDKCEWQNGFNKVGLIWYTEESRINKGIGAGVYGWG